MRRRDLLGVAAALLPTRLAAMPARPPNIVLILADDLGWGDLGSYGNRLIRTPNIDRLAHQGLRMTDFYASANICTPSRAGLLTGRYPIRTGLAHEVIQASDTNGLPDAEFTLPEALKPAYASALVGKWHLGHVAPFWPPARHGFDLFFGLPYSHDMKGVRLFDQRAPGVELTSEPVVFEQLEQRYFERSIEFIEANRARPFFLLLALTAPHVPLRPGKDHAGHSRAGAYGDVVEEVDAGVGRIVVALDRLDLADETILILTSDNGPWFEGSAGTLRAGKGASGWDGGYRVPLIVRWPGRIPAGKTSTAIAMNFDLMPTLLDLAGAAAPPATLDGRSLAGHWLRGAPGPHDELILFNNEQVAAIRTDRWKLVGRSYYRGLDIPLGRFGYWLLFDVRADPSETYNVADRHPEVMTDLKARFTRAEQLFTPLATRKANEFSGGKP